MPYLDRVMESVILDEFVHPQINQGFCHSLFWPQHIFCQGWSLVPLEKKITNDTINIIQLQCYNF